MVFALNRKTYHSWLHGSKADTSLYVLHKGSLILYFLIYVDAIIAIGSSSAAIDRVIRLLNDEFPVKNLSYLNFFSWC